MRDVKVKACEGSKKAVVMMFRRLSPSDPSDARQKQKNNNEGGLYLAIEEDRLMLQPYG